MRFGSVCSGIEAASVAWGPLGWKAAWLSEIEPFPSAVLAHHYPDVPNLGDMAALPERIQAQEVEAPDVFCGGTPCQAFSVAGKRRSLDDARGNLALVFCEIANAIDTTRAVRGEQPTIIFWENVPGVLNTKDNAFGCFLGKLAGEDCTLQPAGGKWTNAGCVFGPQRTVTWRVLDAQYFGVAQRRRRVFVVASARNDFDPVAVLFEFDGVRRDTAPRRDTGQGFTQAVAPCLTSSGRRVERTGDTRGQDPVVGCAITMAHGQGGAEIGFDRGPTLTCNHEAPIAAIAFPANLSGTQYASTEDLSPSMGATNPTAVAIPINTQLGLRGADTSNTKREGVGIGSLGAPAFTLQAAHHHAVAHTTKLHNTGSNNAGKIFRERTTCLDANSPPPALLTAMQVRRLTPTECERLQGFPDGYTAIPWRKKPAADCPDSPRYKALGNSWAVPNVRWIGQRIQNEVDRNKNA